MTVDEFFSVCARMGFSRCGKGYARCLGDGVYQELSAPGTGYLSHSSPEFLQWRRRSPVLELRLRSMYADPSYFRTPQIPFYPENLVGDRYVSGDYQGFANQCDLMLSVGFVVLDTVTTQARLLEWSRKLETAQYPEETPDRSELCPAMILCGELEMAERVLNTSFTHIWMAFHEEYDGLKACGEFEKYLRMEAARTQAAMPVTETLTMLKNGRWGELCMYFDQCLAQNTLDLQRSGALFAPNFNPQYCDLGGDLS